LTRVAEIGSPTYVIEDVQAVISTLRNQRPVGPVVDNDAPFTVVGDDVVLRAPSNVSAHMFKPQRQVEELAEEEEEEEQHAAAAAADDGHGNDASAVYAALLVACRDAGYDSSHERRKELVDILLQVQTGDPFPDDILAPVLEKTRLTSEKAEALLRPQIHQVLTGMQNAVQAEEERLAELERLKQQKRLEELARLEAEHKRVQERLKRMGVCCMGYTWHRQGAGWRCAGGSHYVSDAQVGV
jgi:hypothetical protein